MVWDGTKRHGNDGIFKPKDLGISVLVHIAVVLIIWGIGSLLISRPETIIPIDMTIVPPWAEQTDDPDADPNPPPPEEKAQEKPQPREEEVEKPKVDEKDLDAIVQEKPKPKPKKVKEKPKPKKIVIDKSKAKFVKGKPQPKKPIIKPNKKIIPAKVHGKGTANDKPLSVAEIQKLLNQGYRYGSKNQLATSESQRCVSVIAAAIRREWDRESFTWHPELSPLEVTLKLRQGGVVASFRIIKGSGDATVDRTARAALSRLKRISGLSVEFINQFPELTIEMKPVSSN